MQIGSSETIMLITMAPFMKINLKQVELYCEHSKR